MEAGYLTPTPFAGTAPSFQRTPDYTPLSATNNNTAQRPASTGAASHTSSLDFLLMGDSDSSAQQQQSNGQPQPRPPAQASPSFGAPGSQYGSSHYTGTPAPQEDMPPAYGESSEAVEEATPQSAPQYGSLQQQQPPQQPRSAPAQPQYQYGQQASMPQAQQAPVQTPQQRQPPQQPLQSPVQAQQSPQQIPGQAPWYGQPSSGYGSQGHMPARDVQQTLPQQRQPVPQQHQQAARPPAYGYPSVDAQPQRDPVQALLEAYPNPQTETDRLRKLMEAMMVQFRDHQERVMEYMQGIDHRLANLESDVQELSGKRSGMSRPVKAEEKERERDRYSPPSYLSEPKKPKDKDRKSRKKSGRKESKSNAAADEELARRLQEQFNMEAEQASMKHEAQALTDEEYAQKLQALYLKRDSAIARRESRKDDKKKDSKKAEEKPATPEEKPSLWSRIFGGNDEDDDDDEKEEKEAKLKPKQAKKPDQPAAPAVATQATYPGLPMPATAGRQPTTIQPMPPYAYYPGAPMMVPPGYQYIPLGGGSPFVFQPATGGAPGAPTQQN